MLIDTTEFFSYMWKCVAPAPDEGEDEELATRRFARTWGRRRTFVGEITAVRCVLFGVVVFSTG